MTNKCTYKLYAKFGLNHVSRYGVWIEFNQFYPLNAMYRFGIVVSFGRVELFYGVRKTCR